MNGNSLLLRLKWIALLVSAVSMVSCGNESQGPQSNTDRAPKLTAAALGEQQILETFEYVRREPYHGADVEDGKRQAVVCMACHSLQKGGPNMLGPALHGMFGRQAGGVNGFVYSPALQSSNFVWTPRALDAWLAEPTTFLPGNRMMFVGVPKVQDRHNLIAYLLEQTGATNEQREMRN